MWERERGADLLKLGEIPGVVLCWVVSRIVGRGDVRDAFRVHADMAFGIETRHGGKRDRID